MGPEACADATPDVATLQLPCGAPSDEARPLQEEGEVKAVYGGQGGTERQGGRKHAEAGAGVKAPFAAPPDKDRPRGRWGGALWGGRPGGGDRERRKEARGGKGQLSGQRLRRSLGSGQVKAVGGWGSTMQR